MYAEDGDIKRVGDEIFLCTPKGMEIEGTAQTLADTNFLISKVRRNANFIFEIR